MDSVILDAQGAPVQAVAFCLLREHAFFCLGNFFLKRIARQLDELHAVKQGSGNRAGVICGCDKQNLA